jgi:hypothetical protein
MIAELSREDGRLLDNLNRGKFGSFWTQFKDQLLLFWLDTLCIPDKKKHEQYRKRPIAMMKETYERASQVLVLVAELEHSPSTPYEGAFLRISTSGWMKHLWTLQKGVLGKRLHAKFSDTILVQSAVDRLLSFHGTRTART